jgi:hypothetical protein
MSGQANTCDGVYQVTEIDALTGADTGKFTDRFAFGPFGKRLGASLVGDFKTGGHLLLQPLYNISQET